ncbi:hypothetical protein BDW60DRAFT_202229 [Aspergillus nidulans var. acristatus]
MSPSLPQTTCDTARIDNRKRTRFLYKVKGIGKKLHRHMRPVLITLGGLAGCVLGIVSVVILLAAKIILVLLALVGNLLVSVLLVPAGIIAALSGAAPRVMALRPFHSPACALSKRAPALVIHLPNINLPSVQRLATPSALRRPSTDLSKRSTKATGDNPGASVPYVSNSRRHLSSEPGLDGPEDEAETKNKVEERWVSRLVIDAEEFARAIERPRQSEHEQEGNIAAVLILRTPNFQTRTQTQDQNQDQDQNQGHGGRTARPPVAATWYQFPTGQALLFRLQLQLSPNLAGTSGMSCTSWNEECLMNYLKPWISSHCRLGL